MLGRRYCLYSSLSSIFGGSILLILSNTQYFPRMGVAYTQEYAVFFWGVDTDYTKQWAEFQTVDLVYIKRYAVCSAVDTAHTRQYAVFYSGGY